MIDVRVTDPDRVGVSERWTNNSISDEEVGLEGYELFRRDRAVEGKGGGVLLYIKNVSRARQVEWRNQFPEQVWCKVQCENRDLYIGVCYRTSTDGVYGQNGIIVAFCYYLNYFTFYTIRSIASLEVI